MPDKGKGRAIEDDTSEGEWSRRTAGYVVSRHEVASEGMDPRKGLTVEGEAIAVGANTIAANSAAAKGDVRVEDGRGTSDLGGADRAEGSDRARAVDRSSHCLIRRSASPPTCACSPLSLSSQDAPRRSFSPSIEPAPLSPVIPLSSSLSHHPPHDPVSSILFSPPLHAAMDPQQFIPLVLCPLCDPPSVLSAPVTLRCGHTVCSSHFPQSQPPSVLSSIFSTSSDSSSSIATVPRCPLPTCPAPSSSSTTSSPVGYTPASSDQSWYSTTSPSSRVDVTTNKIISLIHRPRTSPHDTPSAPVPSYAPDADEHTDSEAGDSESELEYISLPDSSQSDDHRQPSPGIPDSDQPPTAAGRAFSPSHPPLARPELTQEQQHGFDTAGPSASCSRVRSRSRSSTGAPMRARKRRRRLPRSHAPPRSPPQETDPTTNFEKELLTELNCEICFALLWQPVTTPCQHTFCSKCLHRSLDHSPACPLCRQTLPGYDYFQEHPCNKVLLAIILKAFPEAYAERGAALEAEERDARLDTPIFVCQLSFPGMPTLLHFFEPRYRLMLRRCLATPHPCFGMVPPARTAPAGGGAGNDYGTMLAIKNVRMLPDGRSLVETWGTWRFRIMERGTLDGYTVGRIERIDDYEEELDGDAEEPPVADAVRAEIGEGVELGVGGAIALTSVVAPPSAQPSAVPPLSLDACSVSRATLLPTLPRVPTNEELMAKCHAFLDQMREGTPWVVQHLNNAYVPMPSDPASFSFWMALILPIDDHEKAKLLPIRSPRLRLRLVVHWIEQLNSNWARSYTSASAWQVVLWRLRRLLIRVLPAPLPRASAWLAAYVLALLAVFVAQALARP